MKKLMTILVLFALCGVAMAQGTDVNPNDPIKLKYREETVNKTDENGNIIYQKDWRGNDKTDRFGNKIPETVKVPKPYEYINIDSDGVKGNSGLKYTIMQNSSSYGDRMANLYFTTTKDVNPGETVIVSFLGTKIEDQKATTTTYGRGPYQYTETTLETVDVNWSVQDYGIYLYDPKNHEMIGDWMSINNATSLNSFDIGAGKDFGVYYVNDSGDYVTTTGDITVNGKTLGWVGNFDVESHEVIVHNEDGTTEPQTTWKHFMCLLKTDTNEFDHWEFMLQTSVDDPKYNVDPHDFPGNGDTFPDEPTTSGQPLPGTLATLLIGGLCAGSLRKRNKK